MVGLTWIKPDGWEQVNSFKVSKTGKSTGPTRLSAMAASTSATAKS